MNLKLNFGKLANFSKFSKAELTSVFLETTASLSVETFACTAQHAPVSTLIIQERVSLESQETQLKNLMVLNQFYQQLIRPSELRVSRNIDI